MARIKVKEDEFSISQAAQKARGEKPVMAAIAKPKPQMRGLSIKAVIILTVMLAGLLGFYIYSLQLERSDLRKEVAKLKADPAIVSRQQTEQLLQKVSRLVELPAGEVAKIADVTDVEKAKQQDVFYKDAQNGDKVIFYEQANKAILYRPSIDRVIATTIIKKQT